MTNPTLQPVTKWNAAATSIGLCVFFVIVYGACNRLTDLRDDVGTWVYAWERLIPFVPVMIIPYLSIDLFFVAAPFLCNDRGELRTFSRRVVMAIVVAAACFLIMPLRFSFERPATAGILGSVFNAFRSLDLPYNQFPSLHIALRTILADLYSRRTRGVTRIATQAWFSLIGASTLLTYQHHVIDIVGGFLLGAACLYLVAGERWRLPVTTTRRVGFYYVGAAAACVAGAAAVPGAWSLLLLWPALSLAVLGSAYFGVGPGVFRKRGGRLPLATLLLLGPSVIGQWLSMRYYARRSRAWDKVTPQVWVGRTLNAQEAREALGRGVTAILDLTAELPEAAPFASHPNYCNLPVLDLTAPTRGQLRDAVAFIDAHVGGGVVYVHCKAGYSRSAAVLAAYLVQSGRAADALAAVAQLREARKGIIIRPDALAAVGAALETPPHGLQGSGAGCGALPGSSFVSAPTKSASSSLRVSSNPRAIG